MRGIADGSGIDFKMFRRIHMIGELTKGACSMFGAWGKATSNGQTVQMRALDWVLLPLLRTSTDPTASIRLSQSTIPAVPSTATPGSTSASQAGSESSPASTSTSSQSQKSESLTPTVPSAKKAASETPSPSSSGTSSSGTRPLKSQFTA